jgi:hypothetical protein
VGRFGGSFVSHFNDLPADGVHISSKPNAIAINLLDKAG